MSEREIIVKSIAELDGVRAPPYLVRGLLTAGAMSVLYGQPKSRKSFIALDLGAHVALGREWHGARVRQGPVVYVVGEGWHGINNRIEAFFRHHGLTRVGVPLYVMQPIKLGGKRARGEAKDDLDAVVVAIQKLGVAPVLIVLDTLNRTMIGDENATADMSAYVQRVDALRVKTGAHVLVVHHSGKDVARGARGSSALLGATDTEILVERGDDLSSLVATVQRDLAEGFRRTFEAKVVDLGADDEGEQVTSLVMLPTDREPDVNKERDRLAFDVLSEIAKRDRTRAQSVGAPCDEHYLVAKDSEWRTTFMTRYRGKAADRAFRRARKALVDADRVGVHDAWVWPVWPEGNGRDELPF